jgi:hypothetical protein
MIALLQMEQGEMPREVEGKVVAASPLRPCPLEPGNAVGGAAGHFMHVRDRMQPPRVRRLAFHGLDAGAFGGRQITGFLQGKGVTFQDEPESDGIGPPHRQNARGRPPHALGVTAHEPQRAGQLDQQQDPRFVLQVAVQYVGSRKQSSFERRAEGFQQRRLCGGQAVTLTRGDVRRILGDARGGDGFGARQNDPAERPLCMGGYRRDRSQARGRWQRQGPAGAP